MAECFCGCAISTLAKHVDPLNTTEQEVHCGPYLKHNNSKAFRPCFFNANFAKNNFM